MFSDCKLWEIISIILNDPRSGLEIRIGRAEVLTSNILASSTVSSKKSSSRSAPKSTWKVPVMNSLATIRHNQLIGMGELFWESQLELEFFETEFLRPNPTQTDSKLGTFGQSSPFLQSGCSLPALVPKETVELFYFRIIFEFKEPSFHLGHKCCHLA